MGGELGLDLGIWGKRRGEGEAYGGSSSRPGI